MQKQQAYLVLILGLVIAAIATLVNLPPQRGLDLRGGAQLTIQVKTTEEVTQITPDKLEAVKNVISNRVNKLGVSEAIVQTANKDRIIVQLPGVSDPQDAEKVLGGTAQLDFRTQTDDPEITAELNVRQQEILELLQNQTTETSPEIVEEIAAKQARIAELSEKLYDKTGLTGKSLQRAYYGAGEIGNSWEVYLNFKSEGAKQFAEITKSIA
ncbi:MAG: protein translocase subunit SecD, partial [Xenococcaceae cyanobacterium MO_167.B52]|nr:protein translocase subunit SecD [Xenococcaceae cyanobacterium MO_167.B52]